MLELMQPFICAGLFGMILGFVLRIYKESKKDCFIGTLVLAIASIPVLYLFLLLSIIPVTYFIVGKKGMIIDLLTEKIYTKVPNIKEKIAQEDFRMFLDENWYRYILRVTVTSILFNLDKLTIILIQLNASVMEEIHKSGFTRIVVEATKSKVRCAFQEMIETRINNVMVAHGKF